MWWNAAGSNSAIYMLQGWGQVGRHLVGLLMSAQRGGEELAGRCDVASPRDVYFDDLAVLVQGPVDVAPGTVKGPFTRSPGLTEHDGSDEAPARGAQLPLPCATRRSDISPAGVGRDWR